jgi:hypothetical protein
MSAPLSAGLRYCGAFALLFATLPLWALPIALIPPRGFVWYLVLSDWYYTVPARLFGGGLFPTREFGTIPNGAAALLLGAVLYAALGAAVGIAVHLARGLVR